MKKAADSRSGVNPADSLSPRLGRFAQRKYVFPMRLRGICMENPPFVRRRQSRRRISHLTCQDSPPAVLPFVRAAERDDGCLKR